MKDRLSLLAAVVTLLALMQVVGWAQDKYVPSGDEELYGTWTNDKTFPPKIVMSPDGTTKQYFPISSLKVFREGTVEIFKKWIGSDGSIYYYTLERLTSGADKGRKTRFLWRVSESGKVLEMVWRPAGSTFDPDGMPTEIDPKDSNYQVFTRSGS